MIEQELFAHLRDTVTSVSGRVYPMIMPQDCEKPALVYTVVNAADDQAVSGCVSATETLFQVDVYASTYAHMKDVTTEVKSSLYTFDSYPMALNSRDIFEEEEELFRQMIEFNTRK